MCFPFSNNWQKKRFLNGQHNESHFFIPLIIVFSLEQLVWPQHFPSVLMAVICFASTNKDHDYGVLSSICQGA